MFWQVQNAVRQFMQLIFLHHLQIWYWQKNWTWWKL